MRLDIALDVHNNGARTEENHHFPLLGFGVLITGRIRIQLRLYLNDLQVTISTFNNIREIIYYLIW